jgi:hypothetical protein
MKWPLAVLQGKGVLGLKAVACGLRAASSASASAILYLQAPRPSHLCAALWHLARSQPPLLAGVLLAPRGGGAERGSGPC